MTVIVGDLKSLHWCCPPKSMTTLRSQTARLYRGFRECQAIGATSSMTFTWIDKIYSAVREVCA
jgi:hypothetical protein